MHVGSFRGGNAPPVYRTWNWRLFQCAWTKLRMIICRLQSSFENSLWCQGLVIAAIARQAIANWRLMNLRSCSNMVFWLWTQTIFLILSVGLLSVIWTCCQQRSPGRIQFWSWWSRHLKVLRTSMQNNLPSTSMMVEVLTFVRLRAPTRCGTVSLMLTIWLLIKIIKLFCWGIVEGLEGHWLLCMLFGFYRSKQIFQSGLGAAWYFLGIFLCL